MRHAPLTALCALAAALTPLTAQAATPDTTRDTFDPRALQLLQKMCDAYAQTTTLDQRTVYYSALIPLNPPRGMKAPEPTSPADPDAPTPQDQKMDRSLHLMVMPPNRLRLELQEPDPKFEDRRRVSIWDCDGKTFWTYAPDTQYYTEEKAPAHPADFAKMRHMTTGSLEMMMLLGLNPFSDIRNQADGAQLGQPDIVRGARTDVVILSTIALSSVTQVRLYIDRDSSLLRRLVVETTPIKYNAPLEPGKVGDDLDALVTNRRGPVPTSDVDPNQPQFITRVTYDNLFGPADSVNLTDFTFKIPPNALLYAPFQMGKPIGPSLKEMLRGLKIARVHKLHVVKP
jgi:outer membrane lipoprotein-sorting protein